MSPFKYNEGKGIVPEGAWRLSPSSAYKFFDKTSEWYREYLLGEAPTFEGSTMSNLGTVVHYCAETYANGKPIDHNAIVNYVKSQSSDIDTMFILDQYSVMAETLVNSYLRSNMPSKTELFLWYEVLPGIGVGGSIDSIYFPITGNPGIIVDYKTTNALTPTDKFSRPYYFQQMLYYWLCKKNGIEINTLRLCYVSTNQVGRISEKTGKNMKDYPSTVTTIDHIITNEDHNLIESVVDLVCESVDTWNKKPELRFLLAQDYRLKSIFKSAPKLFTKE
jgi:hypothetical protein